MIEETVIEIKGSLVSIIISCMKRLTFKRFKIGNFELFSLKNMKCGILFFLKKILEKQNHKKVYVICSI